MVRLLQSIKPTLFFGLHILSGGSTIVNVAWPPAAFEEALQKSGANDIEPEAAWLLGRVFV